MDDRCEKFLLVMAICIAVYDANVRFETTP